jgi:hypothetical protein
LGLPQEQWRNARAGAKSDLQYSVLIQSSTIFKNYEQKKNILKKNMQNMDGAGCCLDVSVFLIQD